jgi:membrane protein implicated in regulation of membrane protease activity
MKKLNLFMEYFWLVVFIISTIVVAYLLLTEGEKHDKLALLLFPVISGVMYMARRFVRRKLEKNGRF